MIKTCVVIGMHRSATSLVAKALANEIDMGAVFRPIADQPAGNWENLDFMQLNIDILKAAGGSWDKPPSHEAIMAVKSRFKKRIKRLVGKFNEKHQPDGIWGWKDPRTVLTIELYKPFLINPHYITIFRNPQEVAKSLQKRNGFSIEFGLDLASIYNSRIIRFLMRNHEDINCTPLD